MLTGESLACCGAGRGAAVECLFDPVVGDALRAVGYGDRAALFESERLKRMSHRRVVLVGVAAQVVSVPSREAEDRPRDPTPTHRSYAVNDVVVGLGMPRAIDRRVGLVRSRSEGEDSKRPLIVGYKETVSARDVFLSINPAGVPFGPLSRIPICLHERAGALIRALDEIEGARGGDSNLHAVTLSVDHGLPANLPTMCP